MATKQRLLPIRNLRNPLVQHQHSRNTTQKQDPNAQHHQSPGSDAQFRHTKTIPRKPSTNVEKTSTAEDIPNDRIEGFTLNLSLEFAILSDDMA